MADAALEIQQCYISLIISNTFQIMKNTSSIITTFDDALSYNCTQEELASPIVSNRTEWSLVCNQTLPEDQCRPQASLVVINSVVNFLLFNYRGFSIIFSIQDSRIVYCFWNFTRTSTIKRFGKIQNNRVGNTDDYRVP